MFTLGDLGKVYTIALPFHFFVYVKKCSNIKTFKFLKLSNPLAYIHLYKHDTWTYKIVINLWIFIMLLLTYIGLDSGSYNGEKRNGPAFMETT